jgi:hypothetical protein
MPKKIIISIAILFTQNSLTFAQGKHKLPLEEYKSLKLIDKTFELYKSLIENNVWTRINYLAHLEAKEVGQEVTAESLLSTARKSLDAAAKLPKASADSAIQNLESLDLENYFQDFVSNHY